jgi:phenylacetate-CoA ligase
MSFEDKFHWLLARYIASPQWVKSSIGAAYSALPMRVRVGRSYESWRELASINQPARVNQLVAEKLQQTLEWALNHVPAYAQYRPLLGSGQDCFAILQQLPLLSKEMIKQGGEAYLATHRTKKHRMAMFTGGSTATPMQFCIEKGVTRVKEYGFIDEFHSRVGLSMNDVVLALRGRSVPGAQDGTRFWMYEPIKKQLILSSDHMLAHNMPDYIRAILEWKPRYIQAFPSALYPLAKWLAQYPEPALAGQFRGVLLFSENVYPHQAELFEKVFGCPVLKHYGHSERALMAASKVGDARYFVYPQYGYTELLDFNGQPVTEPGQLGQLVATSFDNQVMPFVRYQTGDLAVLGRAAPDAQNVPKGALVLERIEGRLQEFVVTHDLRLISIATLGAAHFNELADVGAIQYAQSQPGQVELWVEVAGRLPEAMKQKIAQAVSDKTQGGCTLTVHETGQIPRSIRGKHQMLRQQLDLSQYQKF